MCVYVCVRVATTLHYTQDFHSYFRRRKRESDSRYWSLLLQLIVLCGVCARVYARVCFLRVWCVWEGGQSLASILQRPSHKHTVSVD